MTVSRLVVLLLLLWGLSALLSLWLAARKGRNRRAWSLVGVVLGPFSLLVHAFYPARYQGPTIPCPQCGKPVGERAAACHHCRYRFPALDVMITRLPEDPESRRVIFSEVAREYGIASADAERMLGQLPVAGYRHILPDQVAGYTWQLEARGATVEIVPSPPTPPPGKR